MKRTEIVVDQAGNMQIDQQGFSGTACADMTAKLMRGIASKASTEEKKPEFFNRSEVKSGAAQQRW
jgi:hypothetical protein